MRGNRQINRLGTVNGNRYAKIPLNAYTILTYDEKQNKEYSMIYGTFSINSANVGKQLNQPKFVYEYNLLCVCVWISMCIGLVQFTKMRDKSLKDTAKLHIS